jgi:threonine dehydrogenase-like Zn-dependent dehydrogenase
VATPGGVPSPDLVPSLLVASDVLGTGWFAADAANVKPGGTVVVVGDGAVGLLGVLSARQMGAGRIIAMSRHETARSSPASSAQPTLSLSAVTKASRASRN